MKFLQVKDNLIVNVTQISHIELTRPLIDGGSTLCMNNGATYNLTKDQHEALCFYLSNITVIHTT